jgi:co-chaperonin GroES (HSP10)|tara:strand:- start:455 stop:724 length:270 start_codon:yes stop_codon:yes gene_type:complete
MGIKKMLHNQVLVTSVEREETTTGGIILTKEITKGQKPALVLAVSTGAVLMVSTGDRVFLDWSKSMPVDVDGEAAAIIDVEHIKAILGE